jgi:hypothetical protein
MNAFQNCDGIVPFKYLSQRWRDENQIDSLFKKLPNNWQENLNDEKKMELCHYVCPISLEIMKNPIRHPEDNQYYDRISLYKWYKMNRTSPLTRTYLTISPLEIIEDEDMKKNIISFLQRVHNR